MKNYNKILEAINKGVQLALDDFDDEEQIQNIKSKQINHRDYTKEYLDLMKVVVDLGLHLEHYGVNIILKLIQNQIRIHFLGIFMGIIIHGEKQKLKMSIRTTL